MKAKRSLLIYFIFSLGLALAITGFAVEGSFPSSVSVDGIRILAETFNGYTTDFSTLNSIQIRYLENVILEKTSYGKVAFNEAINLTAVAGGDRTVDFDTNLEISDNLIYIDNANLPFLNKDVTLYIYDLTFTDPQIIKGSSECTDCTLISYSGGTLIFTSDSFVGPYYARETPTTTCGNGVCETGETEVSCPADCTTPEGEASSGGGGATITSETDEPVYTGEYDFKVDPTYFSVEMKKGTYYQKWIEITNNGTADINIGIFLQGDLSDFIFPQINVISLEPGETKPVRLDIYVSGKRLSDVYVGKILFKSSQISREIDVILDVKEQSALFDIRTEVLKKYINPGGRVRANVSLINMGDLRNFDVVLTYKIIDFDKNEYTIKEEQFAVEKYYNNIFYLDVPKGMSMGDYLFYTKVFYPQDNVSAASFDTFTVERISFLSWVILIVLILLLMYLTYRWYENKKKEMYKKAVGQKKKIRGIEEKRKLLPQVIPKLPD